MAAAKPCTSLDPQQFLQEAEPLILPWVFEENKKVDKQALLDWNMNEIDEKFMDSVVSPKPTDVSHKRVGAFTWEQQHPHDPKVIQTRPETPWTVRHKPRKVTHKSKKNAFNKDYHSATMCASLQDCWLSPPPQGQYERFIWEVSLRPPTEKPKIQAQYLNRINFRIGFVEAAIPKGDLRGVFEPTKPGQVAVQVHVAEDRQGKVVGNDTINVKAEGKTILYKWKPKDVELDHKIGDLYALEFDFKKKRVRLYYNGVFVTTIYKKLTRKVLPVMSITTDRGCESIMKCTRVRGFKPSDASK